MAWKRLTFVLIPHSQERVKQISIHRNALYALAVFLVAAIGVMVFYIVGFEGKEFYRNRTRELVEKNTILNRQLAVFDSSLTTLNLRIAHLESLNTSIIKISGISEMDLQRLGGGDVYSWDYERPLAAEKVLALIDRLDRESEAFEYNFGVLYDTCMKNSGLIRCVPSIRPAVGTITREFGRSKDTLAGAGRKSHPGVDITWDEGTPVVATADGVVEEKKYTKELGNYIIIDHGNGYKTRYAHLQSYSQMKNKIKLKKGDRVKRGQQIGAIGRTGISITATPSHLMYSVYHHGVPVNPVDYFFASDFAADAGGDDAAARN